MDRAKHRGPLIYTELSSKSVESKAYRHALESSVLTLNTFYEDTKLPFFASLDEAWNIKIESAVRDVKIEMSLKL